MQAGRANEPNAASIGSVLIRPIVFDPANRAPLAPSIMETQDFLLGL
jgi:hypothetical protein